jgi:tetratricopeptide (TPR) repeat protein
MASYDTGTWEVARSSAVETFNEGVRAMHLGDEAQAISLWERTVELDPTIAPALHNLILYHEGRRAWPRVIALYGQLLALDPFDTRSLIRQASAYVQVSRLAEAISNYERAIRMYPYYRIWYCELAELYERAGRSDVAQQWSDNALQLESDEAEMAFEDGVRQLRMGNFDLAVACFEAVLEEFPANLEARIRLAGAFSESGGLDRALAQLAQALQVAEDARPHVLYHRAQVWVRAGRFDEAIRDLKDALTGLPTFGRAREMLRLLEFHGGAPSGSHSLPGDVSNQNASRSGVPAAGHSVSAPWEGALHAILRRWATKPGPTGRAPRVAVILETSRALAASATRLLQLLDDPVLPRRPDGAHAIFCVEVSDADLPMASGWLGSPAYEAPRIQQWHGPPSGCAIDTALETVLQAGGEDGFNLLLVVATGGVRPTHRPVEATLSALPCFQSVLLTPSGPGTEIARLLGPLVESWLELALE